jgi:hypothetical protein
MTAQRASQRLAGHGRISTFFSLQISKPRFKKLKGTKDFVLYSRVFDKAVAFYYEINYKGT